MAAGMYVIVLRYIVQMIIVALITAGVVIEVSRVVPIIVSMRTIAAAVRWTVSAAPVGSTAVIAMRIPNIDMDAAGLKVEALGIGVLGERTPSYESRHHS
jgi:hypothetical protein